MIINKPIISAFQSNTGRYAHSEIDGHAQFLTDLKSKGCKILDVNVKGKFMYWTFDNDNYLFNTFGMSGQWAPKPGKHPCFGFYFEDGSELHFNDPRHFGTIKFINNKNILLDKLNNLGWDPFTPLTEERKNFIINSLKKSNKEICQDLMNQKIFAGVGNYIKSESLFLSKISPRRKSALISLNEIDILCNSIIAIMSESYKYQGATIHTYSSPYGEEGRYSSCFKVYGKKIDPNGFKISKETTPDKRSSYWVKDLQT